MCSISGIISKRKKDVSGHMLKMLSVLRHRGPDHAGVIISKEVVTAREPSLLDLSNTKGSVAMGYTWLSVAGEEVNYPLSDCHSDLFLVNDGEIFNYQELKNRLKTHSFRTKSNSEVVAHLIEEYSLQKPEETFKRILRQLDGVYAFAIMYEDQIFLARDPIGVKPLYVGEDDNYLAFASERKALWKIGLQKVKAILPGEMAILTNEGCRPSRVFPLEKQEVRKVDLENATLQLKEYLYRAFEKRVSDIKKIGISFSGGLDSSIIAKIAGDLGVDVALYTSGLEGTYDVNMAKKSAPKLGYDLHVRTLTIEEVEKYISKVIYAIEEANVMKVGIALPLYVTSEMAHSEGIKVMFSGQGSDELFGGYDRYLRILREQGYEKMQAEIWNDIQHISEINLQRDDAVTMANSVELRIPFLDLDVVNLAMTFPPALKISGPDDTLKKAILRSLAKDLGLPSDIVKRPKKAVQYGSGTNKAIRKIAKGHGFRNMRDYLNTLLISIFKNEGQPDIQ